MSSLIPTIVPDCPVDESVTAFGAASLA
jgi:hypothetical protein